MNLAIASVKPKFLALAASAMLVGTLSVTPLAEGLLIASKAATDEIAAALRDRSPGKRVTGKIAKSKLALAKGRRPDVPRVTRMREVAALPRPAYVPPALSVEDVAVPPAIPGDVALAYAPPPPVIGGFSPLFVGGGGGGGGIIIGGGGGGGGIAPGPGPGGGGTTPPVVVNPPVPPVAVVPEPQTWAMMLIGFAAVGAALRRRRSETQRRSANRIRQSE